MWKKGGEDGVWGWQAEQEMKGRKKGRREGWGWADGENEGNKREEEPRSGVMAGRLPFNLMVLMVLLVCEATASLPLAVASHTNRRQTGSRAERRADCGSVKDKTGGF